MRLTIHLENPIFFDADQKNVGTKENPIMKPKKVKCIKNTLSFKDVSKSEAQSLIASVRKKHGIAVWEDGARKGEDMIYFAN
jgi:hypothetical protein